ncbi:outer arm dynein light chain 1 protein [Citrus sinensis]|uniref:Outer arm dynein light chain 1 protein n=1 Tax=Citrus sinensis TaxID=2711 RepID=A0ACB8NVK9_CITSI|nr:outer arm dynein light chain 1 protein [Citrus sinensis]KAH9801786.1 outer arm dynein light chain 1 protein [Citrus sinensis]
MAIVTGDRYLEKLVKFVEQQAGPLIEGSIVLKLNPAGLHYVQSRLEALRELERLLAGAPLDYLRAYVSDLGDHRALEQLRRILKLLTSLKVVSALPPPARDPTPLSLLPFCRLKVLELRGCDLSTSAAKGLLELRHTLEKIICHNSTNALRHVFASRIVEIKDSPQWNRLSFVSCSCNRLVIMDESLQLLPAVETLDLSRNKFAKVDNLRKCVNLKHLDLGFNNLRSIAAFSEVWTHSPILCPCCGIMQVSCHIVKLVLRNNALTTLRGIENLKSLEGLDISYNIISTFSELEFLASLPYLLNLWLEGNPLCCSRWYRAQVFSYFAHPAKLKVDGKEISTRELWERQLIIARRQKRPAGFGFYSPAKGNADGDGNANRKRKKACRLASIESEEESTCVGSDRESVSCDNEIESKEENVASDDDAEIIDLMSRVEHMKRERSILWLREFKEWMDHTSENFVDGSICSGATLMNCEEDNYIKNKRSQPHLAESSKYVSGSVQASGDESSTNILESENSYADMPTGLHAYQSFDHIGSLGITGGFSLPGIGRMELRQENEKPYLHDGAGAATVQSKSFHQDTFTIQDRRMVENIHESPLTPIDDITDAFSSSARPGSPPHYREDILHRRHNLVAEILQLSAESYSVVSSDSKTSCSDDDFREYGPSMLEVDQSINPEHEYSSAEVHSLLNLFEEDHNDQPHEIDCQRENCKNNGFSAGGNDGEVDSSVNQEAHLLEKNKRKHTRRVISLLKEQNTVAKTEALQNLNGNLNISEADNVGEQGKHIFGLNYLLRTSDKKQTRENAVMTPYISGIGSVAKFLSSVKEDFVEDYFNKNVADSKSHETCMQYTVCWILEQDFMHRGSVGGNFNLIELDFLLPELAKWEAKYLNNYTRLMINIRSILNLLGCHKIEDIREVLIGLGLQVLSLEQVQVELFEKQICGGLKVGIFQYSMVLFWCSEDKESWLSRSLFLIEGHVLVCIEDLMQFSSLSVDVFSPPYYLVDLCCSIDNVSEIVIDARETCCVSLAVQHSTSEFCPLVTAASGVTACKKVAAIRTKRTYIGSLKWKFKWFSEEDLFNFVALVKAMHAETTASPLQIRCVS